jgi:putative flavoprotein involved in K+ transport
VPFWPKLDKLYPDRPVGPSRMKVVEKLATHAECLIIGGGHNGLSVAAELKKNGVEPIILEQNAAVGEQWKNRYERLHLHHITDAMHLPGLSYPDHVPRYLSRLDLADYLQAYAQVNNLDVRTRHRVTRLNKRDSGGWEAQVQREGDAGPITFTADEVVLAAGVSGITARKPDLKGADDWAGEVLHSQQYQNADGYEGKRVLIVGSGNSGVELCCDLYDHGAIPSMLIRSPNCWLTRETFAFYHRLVEVGGPILKYLPFSWVFAPAVIFGFDWYLQWDVKRRYGDLSSKGIHHHRATPMYRLVKTAGEHAPTYVDGTWGEVGVSIFDLIREDKVPTFTAEISHLEPDSKTVVFTDGQRADFDVVLLCTGFEPISSHYATFVDPSVLKVMGEPGVFRLREEMPGLPGLWAVLGGFAGSRYGQVIMAKRIAAKVQKHKPPARILSGWTAYALSGPDPALLQVCKRTIVINVVAALALLAWITGYL